MPEVNWGDDMENKILVMILGLAVFGFFLFGCASQQADGTDAAADNDSAGPATMTCAEYCLTQPHVQCVGTWSISGTYPDCICNYTCETQEEPQGENGSDIEVEIDGTLPMSAGVDIIGYKFMPETIEVSVGATVTWMNKDGPAHAIVSDTEAFSSSTIVTGQTYSYTFETAGNYSYHCGIHPSMYGTIIVR